MYNSFFTDYQKSLLEQCAGLRNMTPDEVIQWQMLVERNGNWDYYTGGTSLGRSSIYGLFGIKL
jgi:hypothetical protein